MAVVRNLMVRAGADFSALRRETERAQQTMQNFQRNMSNTMNKIKNTIIAIGIGKAIKDSISSAMNVEASLQQIDRIMGTNAESFKNWANTQAIAFNMSKQEALKYGAVYGNLMRGFAKNSSETTAYTKELLKASSVIASSTGRTMEDVMERIRSGILGNTEAIEDLGIYAQVGMIKTTDAFKKLANGKTWDQLDYQTQQQIRVMSILEQSSEQFGTSVNQNTNSSLQQLVAHLKNIQLSLGQAFLPIVQIILPVLTALATKLEYVMAIVAQFSQALFGKASTAKSQAKVATQQANAVSGIGDAYGEAGKQAKKAGKDAKGALAGFDEINSVSKSSSDASGNDGGGNSLGAAGIGTGEVPINFDTNAPEISGKVQTMAEMVKGKINEIKEVIISNKEIIISALSGILAGFLAFKTLTFLSQLPTIIGGVGASLSILLSPIAIASAAIGALVAAFVYLYQTNEDFRNRINQVWSEISNTLNGFVNNTLKPIFDYIVNEFLAPIGKAFKEYILPVLADLFVGMGNIFNDILKLIQSTIDNVWGILKPAFELVKTIVIDVLEIIKGLWDKYGQDIIGNVRGFIQGLQDTFQLIWDNILNPIIKPALEMLTWLWEKHLKGLVQQIGEFIMKCVNGALELYNGFIKPIIDWMVVTFGPKIVKVVTGVVSTFGNMLAVISDVIKGLLKALGGVIDFLVGVFTGNWKKAWGGVKDIFKGIFDSLVGIVKAPLNLIIDAINKVIRGANGAKDVLNKLPGVNIGSIPTIPKLAKGGIVSSATIAMVGEAGKEAVMPLENNTGWISELADKINSKGGNSSPLTVILRVGKTELARVVAEGINDLSKQTGELILDI